MNGQADGSWKFGAGRFCMRRGLLSEAAEEILRYGARPAIVGGPTAIDIVRPLLEPALEKAGTEGIFMTHGGQVCHRDAQKVADAARAAGADVVVAAGGGRAMDFGKLVAYYLGARVVCVPTSISTCASYSPFSLIYTPEGRTIPGNFCYEQENAAILVDLDVMAHQPARLAMSGLLDALGKRVEIHSGSLALPRKGASLMQYAGYLLAGFTFTELEEKADGVLEALQKGEVTENLQDMVLLNIPLTGIISALSGGVGQSAIAHELYYQCRMYFTAETQQALHGEIVGVGILPQLYYNGQEDRIDWMKAFLERIGAPGNLTELGFPLTDANYEQLVEAMMQSAFVGRDEASRLKFRRGMELIAR